jgi:hypothetical protein
MMALHRERGLRPWAKAIIDGPPVNETKRTNVFIGSRKGQGRGTLVFEARAGTLDLSNQLDTLKPAWPLGAARGAARHAGRFRQAVRGGGCEPRR